MSTPRKEIRARRGIERRALTDAEKSAGYIGAVRSVIPYNSDSGEIRERGTNKGVAFVERVAPGAFKRSLDKPGDIIAFVGHTDDPLSAFARAGANLTFTETTDGLQWEALAPDTAACRDLIKLVDSGVIKGASFEFSVRGTDGEKWEKRDGRDVRIITDAALYAVNPVAWPAYEESELTVAMRSRSERGIDAYAFSYEYERAFDDVTYAEKSLASAINRFNAAKSYLRDVPGGAHIERANAEVTAAVADVKALIDWLAANGTTPDAGTVARAREIIGEKRDNKPAPEPANNFPERSLWAARLGLRTSTP